MHCRSLFTHMGYSIRTSDWRYSEWWEWDGELLRPKWGNVSALVGGSRTSSDIAWLAAARGAVACGCRGVMM